MRRHVTPYRPQHRPVGLLVAVAMLAYQADASAASPATNPMAPAAAQVTVEDGLREVLDDALAANLELRAGAAAIEQRLAALDQARARYLPVLDVAARYSWADGGRTIEFPVGDLLNPVYATLDELLIASGQPATSRRPSWCSSSRSTSHASAPPSPRVVQRSTGPPPTSTRCARA